MCDGINWTVIHENSMVKIITENKNTVYVYYLQYKETVLRFAHVVITSIFDPFLEMLAGNVFPIFLKFM